MSDEPPDRTGGAEHDDAAHETELTAVLDALAHQAGRNLPPLELDPETEEILRRRLGRPSSDTP